MTATATIDRPSAAKPVSRRRSAKPATVSASALAQHLDRSRTYIGKLEAEGVIQRQGDGFPLGPTKEILTQERLEALYGAPVQMIADLGGTAFIPG